MGCTRPDLSHCVYRRPRVIKPGQCKFCNEVDHFASSCALSLILNMALRRSATCPSAWGSMLKSRPSVRFAYHGLDNGSGTVFANTLVTYTLEVSNLKRLTGEIPRERTMGGCGSNAIGDG